MKLILAALATTYAASLSVTALTVGALAGLLVGLHIGSRHAIRRTGVGMVRGGARRVAKGRL